MHLMTIFGQARGAAAPPVSLLQRPWSHVGAGYTGQYWANGEPRLFRDSGGNRVLPVIHATDGLRLRVTADRGANWTTAAPASGTPLAGHRYMSCAQTTDGAVHLLSQYFAEPYYTRLALTRTSGNVTGYSVVAGPIRVFGTIVQEDHNTTIRAIYDAAGDECLLLQICATGGGGIQVWAQKTLTAAPSSAADFTQLGGSAGSTQIMAYATPAHSGNSAHEFGAHVVQVPATRELVFASSRIVAEGYTDLPHRTRIATTDGSHTWALATEVVRTEGAQVLGMCSTTDRALLLVNYISAAQPLVAYGMSIDSLSVADGYTRGWIARPPGWDGIYLTAGAIACNAAGTRVYAAHETWTTGARSAIAAYVSGAWTEHSLVPNTADGQNWGLGTSIGEDGLFAVRHEATFNDFSSWVAVLTAEPA